MNRDILARLENIRNDKLFRAYVKIKTQWLENIKDKKPNGTPQQMEDLENHKAYVLTLVRSIDRFHFIDAQLEKSRGMDWESTLF